MHARRRGRRSTRLIRIVVGAALAIGTTTAIGITVAAADDGPGCADGHGCLWRGGNYSGSKVVLSQDDAGVWIQISVFDNWGHSYKNRFGNRYVKVRNGTNGWVGCRGPGGQDPATDQYYNWARVGLAGSQC
jgi:hypothetical protein